MLNFKSVKLYISFFLLSVLLTQCAKDDEATVPSESPEVTVPENNEYAGVDSRLWAGFQEFEVQAANRGISIDLASMDLTAVIEDIDGEGVAGQCNYTGDNRRIIMDAAFWQMFNPEIREMILFHELGHCVLGEGHREGVNDDGTCSSIMRSGLEDCRDNYNTETRTDYLNELFNNAL